MRAANESDARAPAKESPFPPPLSRRSRQTDRIPDHGRDGSPERKAQLELSDGQQDLVVERAAREQRRGEQGLHCVADAHLGDFRLLEREVQGARARDDVVRIHLERDASVGTLRRGGASRRGFRMRRRRRKKNRKKKKAEGMSARGWVLARTRRAKNKKNKQTKNRQPEKRGIGGIGHPPPALFRSEDASLPYRASPRVQLIRDDSLLTCVAGASRKGRLSLISFSIFPSAVKDWKMSPTSNKPVSRCSLSTVNTSAARG